MFLLENCYRHKPFLLKLHHCSYNIFANSFYLLFTLCYLAAKIILVNILNNNFQWALYTFCIINWLIVSFSAEPGEPLAPPHLLDHASKAAESVADELLRAEGRPLALHDDPALPCHLLLPDDGYSCDVVHGVPPGLADFLQPLQAAGLCRLAAQPTSAGQWTVYMGGAGRPGSVVSATQPEVNHTNIKFFV